MNNYKLYISITASYFLAIAASDEDKKTIEAFKPYWGAVTANQHNQTAGKIKDAVYATAATLDPEKMKTSGKSFSTGLVSGLSDDELRAKGHKIGEGIALGLAAGTAKAGKAALAYTPQAVVTGGLLYGMSVLVGVEKNKTYGRCIRTHWDDTANERGIPMRCESPERRALWWNPNIAERQNTYSRLLRAQGRRPRRLTDENYYEMGEISFKDIDPKD